MAAGYKDWTSGDVLTAADLEDYTVLQSVMRFASAAARDSALAVVKTEGMLALLLDTNTLTIYSGSAWSTIGPVHGALTSWTPTVTQSVSVAATVTYARYQRIGRMVMGWFWVTATASGSASNPVIIGGLPVAAAQASLPVGTARLVDQSAPAAYQGVCFLESTTTISLHTTQAAAADNRLGNVIFTSGLANTDVIEGHFMYEAAADA